MSGQVVKDIPPVIGLYRLYGDSWIMDLEFVRLVSSINTSRSSTDLNHLMLFGNLTHTLASA